MHRNQDLSYGSLILRGITKAFQVLLFALVLGLLIISILNTTVLNEKFDETSILISSIIIIVITILGFHSHETECSNSDLNRKDFLIMIIFAVIGAILLWWIIGKDALTIMALVAFSGFFMAYFYYSLIRQ